MTTYDIASKIKAGYNELRKNTIYKTYTVTHEITVENDGGFRAIIIGNTSGTSNSRGYMNLFYTNDNHVSFPTIREIERRLKIIVNKEVLSDEDACYFDWEEFGTLEKQMEYFSEIIKAMVDKK